MLRTITPSEMKRVENQVMEQTSITGDLLMQRAAAHVADTVLEALKGKKGTVLCLCGTGNNGGDGMAAMRILAQREKDFQGECWILPGKLSSDAQRELDRLLRTDVVVRRVEEQIPQLPQSVSCAVDALFGTGLCRPLEGLALEACRLLNSLNVPVVAVDIPSGLSGATGMMLGDAVRADCTVTFHRAKPGLYLGQGPDAAGRIVIGDIGIPERLDDAGGFDVLEEKDLAVLLPADGRIARDGRSSGDRGYGGASQRCRSCNGGLSGKRCGYRTGALPLRHLPAAASRSQCSMVIAFGGAGTL